MRHRILKLIPSAWYWAAVPVRVEVAGESTCGHMCGRHIFLAPRYSRALEYHVRAGELSITHEEELDRVACKRCSNNN